MAEYHRFVAYIYEYINGRKSKNAGFVKVECRNGICRMQLHIQNSFGEDGVYEIHGIMRGQEGFETVFLGIGHGQNQQIEGQVLTPSDSLGGSEYQIEDLAGIWIFGQNGHQWMSVFGEEPIDIRTLNKKEAEPALFVSEPGPERSEPEQHPEQERSEPDLPEPEQPDSEQYQEPEPPKSEQRLEPEQINPEQRQETEPPESEQPPEPEQSSPEQPLQPEIQQQEQSKREKTVEPDIRWQHATASYPHVQPIADATVTDTIRIRPSDLRILWQNGWRQGTNSFLMHGFYTYKHLLLGKLGKGEYFVGVPGNDDEKEREMAIFFGFPEFRPSKEQKETGRSGYWCRPVN